MLWRKRFYRSVIVPVSGIILAIFWMEAIHQFAGPLLPSLFAPTVVEAAVTSIDPTANGTTVQGTLSGCATSFDCINDGARSPTAPALPTTEYVQFSRNQLAHYQMADISSVNTVSSITVYMWHLEGAASFQFQVGLYDTNETTQFGATQNLPIRTGTPGWDSVTISGLSLTQTQINNLSIRTTCTRPGTGNSNCQNYSMYAEVTYTETNTATVSSLGTQQNVTKNSNQYLGGSFAVVRSSGAANVTSVTINETGSIDAAANLKNIKLFYEQDTTGALDCAAETYGGTELQFGGTISAGFSGANGSATFTGSSIGISSTAALCLYVVADVQSGATAGDNVEIQISNPSTDVVGDGGLVVSPGTTIAITGASTVTEATPSQSGYHWRNDDGNEAGATSATGEENTTYNSFPKATAKRLRIQVSNIGNQTTASIQYRLEYASKTGFSACGDVNTGWTDVGGAGGDFDMSNSANLTEGNNTVDISPASGGVLNPGGKTFQATNAGIKDTSSQTAGITLTSSQFVEMEYSIQSSAGVSDGSTYCFRITNAGTPLTSYVQYPEVTFSADIIASASGSQSTSASIPSPDNYLGGVFVIKDAGGVSNTLTNITISEIGSVDAQNGLAEVQLRYDLDTSNPYICDDQSYGLGDTTFGSATTFNGSNQASFSGSVTVGTSQAVCVYVEYNVTASSSNGDTVEIEILDPSSDIVVTSSTIGPASAISPTGSTELQSSVVKQENYHWRNNDGTEASASSATGGTQNTPYSEFSRNSTARLRLAVANTGLASAPESVYQIQWGQKIAGCGDIVSWNNLDASADEWEMVSTPNLTHGADTTDVAEGDGGVGDPAGSFLTDNNGQVVTSDTSASSTLTASTYLDLEYAFRATDVALQGATYCFRVIANGSPLSTYTNYPEATIKLNTDFKIQRGVSTMTGATLTLTAGTEYEAPSSASNAFIRITNTQLTGAGPNTGNGNSNADDVTAYFTDPNNITSSVSLSRGPFPTGNTRISWEIIEYTGVAGGDNEIIVRSTNAATYGAGNTTVNGGTVAGVVDNNDVVVFITAQYNPDAGRNSFDQTLSTSAWNSGSSQPDFTRNSSGVATALSYAVVEFTGSNWNTQRVEHTYSLASTTETETMPPVNSLTRAFLHVQKRTSQTNHADFGHEVWLSGLGQITFVIDNDASIPSGHTSVAWVIENYQTLGLKMKVSPSVGTLPSAGTGPESNIISIGNTITDLTTASIFTNNRSSGVSRSWPEPILGATLLSSTQYELWRSDGGEAIKYRTEVVEWPTAVRKLEQSHFRIYENNGLLLPTTAWPSATSTLGENEPMTGNDSPMAPGDVARIRMTLKVTGSAMAANLDSFKLQYASTTGSCGAAGTWEDLGDPGSGAAWRGFDNASTTDGTVLSIDPPAGGDLLISVATVAGTYEEQNNSTLNPYTAFPDDEVEFDWVVQHNSPEDKTSYCFRMTEAGGALLNVYNNYPVLRTVGFDPRIADWRWYDDETSLNPSSALATENITPSNIANTNAIKLRVVLAESSGADGVDVKFALQYSEYADFSKGVNTLEATTTCVENSLWCYYDGNGTDNQRVTSSLLSSADVCTTGNESGCGTHNESISTTTATYDQLAYTSSEYEFSILHAGARVNTVYYFRLYDVVNDEEVLLLSGSSYPSVVTEGAKLNFSVAGVNAGDLIAAETMDATTTASQISFDEFVFNTPQEAAQQVVIDTNATEGYQLLMYTSQQLVNEFADEIQPITSSNITPSAWTDVCTAAVTSCVGYHTTDGALAGGSVRFGATDSYAALSVNPEEVSFSSIPTVDSEEIVYRIQISENQPVGNYETTIIYLAVPVH